MEVAVKHLQFNNVNERAITDFHTELAVMKSLRHPNIVLAMGACVHPVCLVTEFCANGSLFDVLHNDNIVLSGRMKLKLAYDIVSIFKISTSICQPFVVEDF
jgi:serine/threonine protein kinase|tara:strand:+ start:674 stop:979 length:306 start_codon:yes stop_codon:yes gene_type:complete